MGSGDVKSYRHCVAGGQQQAAAGCRRGRIGSDDARWTGALHHIRCVLITPFGIPVEPEVNSSLATVSGLTAAAATSTWFVGAVASKASKLVAQRPGSRRTITTSTSSGMQARSAAA